MAGSYESYVSRLSFGNPSLKNLSSFLVQKAGTLVKSNIQYAEIQEDGVLGPSCKTNSNELVSRLDSQPGKNILAVVENVHPEDIEILGSALSINPFFFCGHIASSYQGLEKAATPPLLALPPSQLISQGFLNIHYQKVLDLGRTSECGHEPYHLTLLSNVPRKVRRLPALSGRSIGLLRGCTSLIKHSLPGGFWLCLILMDPVADIIAHSAQGCYGSCVSRISQVPRHIATESPQELPSYTELQTADEIHATPEYLGPCGELLSYYRQLPPGWKGGKPSILSLSYHPIQIINREWILYASLMSRYIKYYEYSLPTVSSQLKNFEKIDIIDLHRWRRRSQQSLHKLKLVRLFIEHWRAKELELSSQEKMRVEGIIPTESLSAWDLLLMDINHLEEQIDGHAQSLEGMNPIIASLVQLMDSHRSITQADDVRRLTYIAIAFIPLSYITGIFSMSDPYSPGGGRFWVYWVIAVPVTASLMGFLILKNMLPVWKI